MRRGRAKGNDRGLRGLRVIATIAGMNVIGLFAPALFLSAFLLFWVQPLFAKMVLPLLGGAPAVWNTAMVFFQVMLLGGYLYAHVLARRVPGRAQVAVHGLVLALGLVALPIAAPAGVVPPAEGSPIGWLLGVLALGVGVPFFALSATAPLLQAWFARAGGARAGDPYFLYAASNPGSLLSLLAFPLLLEPGLTLSAQARLWLAGYLVLLALVLACGWRARDGVTVAEGPRVPADGRPRGRGSC